MQDQTVNDSEHLSTAAQKKSSPPHEVDFDTLSNPALMVPGMSSYAIASEDRHPSDNTPVGSEGSQRSSESISLDLKHHIDQKMGELMEQNRKDMETILMTLQHESARRISLEQRFHSQLLLQNESMVAMELKLLRLEARVENREVARRHQGASRNTNPGAIETIHERGVESDRAEATPRIATRPTTLAIVTSGDSLGSAAPEDEVGSQLSTPTQGSRVNNPITGGNLESILTNPMLVGDASATQSHSMRAVRGGSVPDSSVATSVTNSTLTATIGTAAITRGESIRGRYLSIDPENRRTTSVLTDDASSTDEALRTPREDRPRSRSNSPLTVPSYTAASEVQSQGSDASKSTAIMSSVAVAAPRTRRSLSGEVTSNPSRPLADRVVSFTTDMLQNQVAPLNDNGDSITIPEELDNLSDIADTVASTARAWREDYESRLDAIQNRMANE